MKENSAKSIAVGIAVKIVLLAVLVLVLILPADGPTHSDIRYLHRKR